MAAVSPQTRAELCVGAFMCSVCQPLGTGRRHWLCKLLIPTSSSTPGQVHRAGPNGKLPARCEKALSFHFKSSGLQIDWILGFLEQCGLAGPSGLLQTSSDLSPALPTHSGSTSVPTSYFPSGPRGKVFLVAWHSLASCSLGRSVPKSRLSASDPSRRSQCAHWKYGLHGRFPCLSFLHGQILSPCCTHCGWRPAISWCPTCRVL